MATIGSDLAQSASARPAVRAAIDNVQNCSESPACGSNASQDSNDVAAGPASAASTTSTTASAAIRNPMAPGDGRQACTATGF
jgi:hypothetical protein